VDALVAAWGSGFKVLGQRKKEWMQPSPLLLVGATNRPQEIDDAARRRLPKQVRIVRCVVWRGRGGLHRGGEVERVLTDGGRERRRGDTVVHPTAM
jgi:hypothetical protein